MDVTVAQLRADARLQSVAETKTANDIQAALAAQADDFQDLAQRNAELQATVDELSAQLAQTQKLLADAIANPVMPGVDEDMEDEEIDNYLKSLTKKNGIS